MEKSHNGSLDILTGTSEKVSYTNLPWNLADHSWEDSNSWQQFAGICIGVRCGLPRLSSQNILIKDGSLHEFVLFEAEKRFLRPNRLNKFKSCDLDGHFNIS